MVFAQIAAAASSEDVPNWDVIKEQQASVDLPYLYIIIIEDLEPGDAMHLSAESYIEVGRRLAQVYLLIIK